MKKLLAVIIGISMIMTSVCYGSNYDNTSKTPIKGMEGLYILDKTPDDDFIRNDKVIIDEEGNVLTDEYSYISDEVGLGGTIKVGVSYAGIIELKGVLNSDLRLIAGCGNAGWTPKEKDGVIYIVGEDGVGYSYYRDLEGNSYNSEEEVIAGAKTIYDISEWAKDDVNNAIENNIVPGDLKSSYKRNITREEFCQLAVQTYFSKMNINFDKEQYTHDPFIDIHSPYITAAYELGIVKGEEDNKFKPTNTITRQEAAVMLDNLLNIIGADKSKRIDKFDDDNEFASWSKEAIYSVSAYKNGDISVMKGTGENRFSPHLNLTREQAIIAMLRIYKLNIND